MEALLVTLAIVYVVITLFRMVHLVPQYRMDIVERFGHYNRTLGPGVHMLVPFVERVRGAVDVREIQQTFPPQAAITADNHHISIDTVLQYRVEDPMRAAYESFHQRIDQLTVTTLRFTC